MQNGAKQHISEKYPILTKSINPSNGKSLPELKLDTGTESSECNYKQLQPHL